VAARRVVVNPAHYGRDRQLETCLQCHLETTSSPLPFQVRRYEQPAFAYTPGKALADYFIPAITKTKFDAMRVASADPDVTLVPGEGSMMVFVSRNAAGVSGVTATTTPQAFYQPFYDGSAETTFTQSGTSGFGIVWVPGLDVGTATISVKDVGGVAGSVTGPIFEGGITFANIILGPSAP